MFYGIGKRDPRRTLVIVLRWILATIMAAIIIVAFMRVSDALLQANSETAAAQQVYAASMRLRNLGAPCTTETDRSEGTCNVHLKPIYWSGK